MNKRRGDKIADQKDAHKSLHIDGDKNIVDESEKNKRSEKQLFLNELF